MCLRTSETQVLQTRHYVRNGSHLSHVSPIKPNGQRPSSVLHISHPPSWLPPRPCQYSEGFCWLSPGIQPSAHQSHSISSTTSDFSLSGTLSLLMTAFSLLLYFSLFGLNAMLHYFKYLLPISSIFFSWSFILSTWENPAWAQSNSLAFLKEPTLLSALRNISNKLVSFASLNVWFSDSTDFSKECWWSRFIPKYL